MAKKKSKPTGKRPKRPAEKPGRRPKSNDQVNEKLVELAELISQLGGLGGTPPDEAHMLLNEAFQSNDKNERTRLARLALEVSPDCADAYMFLADEAQSRQETFQLYEKALEVAERALGPEVFRKDVGDFWHLVETRPYMRARESLAHFLWNMGRRDEAVNHFQDMLRLNPEDNQGVRYSLAHWLLSEGRDDELARLLAGYDESSAAWAYAKALLSFRQEGDTVKARKLLDVARKLNKFVPDYLLDRKLLPSAPPPAYASGTEEEAIIYVAGALSGWKSTAGATDWLKQSDPRKKKRSRESKNQGPLPLVKKRLGRLPQEFDVWQVDCRHMGTRVEEEGELFNPWLVLVASVSSGLIMAQKVSLEPPTVALIWDVLAEAMQRPPADQPHRPTEIQARPDESSEELGRHLDDIGVPLALVEELEVTDFLFADLKESMGRDEPPGLLEMPGVDRERVAAFHQAAAEFYRRTPWRKLGFESAIRIATDRYESGPWYAVIMGQSGITFGVALYEDLKILKKLWTGTLSDEENTRETVALSITFGEAAESTDADLDAIEEYDFEIAAPNAYPSVFRKERGLTMRPPLAWELELMEGCLRAIPDFVNQYPPDELSTHALTVPVASGPLTLTMAWLDD